MIDLRYRELPDAIEVGGIEYEVDTDFRTWIAFRADYERGVVPFYIFKGDPPAEPFEAAALAFASNPNATPRPTAGSHERTLDMVLDGEYIVASFQAAYGIDLTDPDLSMHWHRFKALLDGLPENSKLGTIMGYRAWSPSSERHDTAMRRLREAWRLPEVGEQEQVDEARSIAEALYERANGGE